MDVKIVKETKYRVKSVWKTLQGEGLFAGRPAVFVRMVGCNLWSGYADTRERDAARTGASCPMWCDTDFTKEGSKAYTASELAKEMRSKGGDINFCVVTGGEPLLHLDAALVEALHQAGFFIAIETNGTVPLQEACWSETHGKLLAPDWIVCSPKLPQEELTLEYFDELKLVLPDYHPKNYQAFAQRQRYNEVQNNPLPLLWLQPEDGTRLQEATQMAINYALDNPEWRVSVQTHKILNVE
ncbi:organic radical activating enzyme [Pontibacter aydingkolensis]|uniref:7-carboxy-7-deazaguanine synthase n=1 Tax=Pontibacter aydingkolensis TaxID=1911536 RepID=A0ABS7CR89_9BACT|nr:7-carboxy-7-deazaguanine synthase QueE [Pontibacter aydingkolensis]MBW7466345.1 7-carboxy-7-deazaguanine synthase QueE [Pontibacter aydingkolensis]